MSYKKEEIDKLISEVMEEMLNERFDIDIAGKSKDDIDTELGIAGKNIDPVDYAKFSKKAKPDNQISDDDFLVSLALKSGSYKKFAQNVINSTTNPEIRALGQKLSDLEPAELKDVYTSVLRKHSVPALDIPQAETDIDDPDSYPISGTRLVQAGQMPDSTIAVFNKFFEGTNNISERIKKLTGFANAVQDAATGDKAALAEWGKDKGIDDIIISSQVLKTMGQITREVSATEAGKFFEAFTAVLLGGAVVGGASGAADVLAGKKSQIYLSQKLYGDDGFKQAVGKINGKGLLATTQKGPIWYLVGIKGSGGYWVTGQGKATSQIDQVDMYGFRIDQPKQTRSGWSFPVFDLEGKFLTNLNYMKNGSLILGSAIQDRTLIGTVPIAIVDTKDINSLDDMLLKAFTELNDTTLNALQGIYEKLNNMKVNTEKYIADKGEAEGNAIISNYGNMKSDVNDMFAAFATKGSAPKTLAISENKQKALDKLIEEVILKSILEGK